MNIFDSFGNFIHEAYINTTELRRQLKGFYAVDTPLSRMGLDVYEINELLASFGELIDDRIDVDQIIMYGIYHDKNIDEINDELSGGGFYPVLKTTKKMNI